MSSFKFNAKEFEKQIMKQIKNQKIELTCPQCDLYCGEYLLQELENWEKIYCNNCGILIEYSLNYNN